MDLRIATATDVGRRRENNEDAVASRRHVVAVADGLGGHAAGEVASRLAADTAVELAEAALAEASEDLPNALADAVRSANRAVHADALAHPDRFGMGTTLTLAAVADARVVVAHVGDSRAYLLRDGDLRQLTTDHATGPFTLTRVVGTDPDVEVDVEEAALQAHDRLLLCSDGLTAVVGDRELPELLHAGEPQAVADHLVALTLDRGAPDNVTVAVVEVA